MHKQIHSYSRSKTSIHRCVYCMCIYSKMVKKTKYRKRRRRESKKYNTHTPNHNRKYSTVIQTILSILNANTHLCMYERSLAFRNVSTFSFYFVLCLFFFRLQKMRNFFVWRFGTLTSLPYKIMMIIKYWYELIARSLVLSRVFWLAKARTPKPKICA